MKQTGMISFKKVLALGLVLGGGVVLSILLQGFLYFIETPHTKQNMEKKNDAEEALSPFRNLTLEARAAYVLDLRTKEVLFIKNENEKLPLASVTKLMTTLVARDNLPASAVLTITSDDLETEGDSGLRIGERWRIGDLLNLMLIISSNDAAHAVASFVGRSVQLGHDDSPKISRINFVKMMNDEAIALGLNQMEFFNESGLDFEATQNGLPVQAGGYGSAHDVALLFAELWSRYPDVLEITSHKDARIYSQDNIAHILPNTNEIVGHLPGLVASKTGYTDLSGGNLAIIFDKGVGDPVVAVVLGSTYKGRFDDMKKIVNTVVQVEIPEKTTL